ncbi:ABC transporter [Cryptosporidium ryanae]|uniref:ABC transporter n=1 Tax=Cryptosporidium ryanae TaxID=515981 RepID=UPI00351A3C2B|nr:ABC transporter [Cryptosporidium ryanae]
MSGFDKFERYHKNILQRQAWGHPKQTSIWSKLTLGWLDEYIYKSSEGSSKNPSDFPRILESDSAIYWANRLEEEIMRIYRKNRKDDDGNAYSVNIFLVLFNLLRGSLFKILIGKFFCEFLGIIIATILNQNLNTIEKISKLDPNSSLEYENERKKGIFLAISIGILQLVMILCSTQLGYYICRLTVRIQGSITHIIYRSLLYRGINRIDYFPGDSTDNEDTTSIFNSILVDMNVIVKVITSIVDVVIIPIRIIMVISVLTKTMGGSTLSRPAMYCIIFMSLFVVILEFCVAIFKWNYLIKRDKRMILMDFMIRKISTIKFMGLESLFYWIINRSRIDELRTRKKFILFQSISSVLYSTGNLITQYVLFRTAVVYSVLYKLDFSPGNIVTSYFVIDMFSQRLSDLPVLISTIVEGNNSRIRLEPLIRYLIIKNVEMQDNRRDIKLECSIGVEDHLDHQNSSLAFESVINTEDGNFLEDSVNCPGNTNINVNINIDDDHKYSKLRTLNDNNIVLIKNVELINETHDNRININTFQVEKNCLTILEDHSSERLLIFIQTVLGYNDFGCHIGPRINNFKDSIFYIKNILEIPIFWCPHDPWIPSGTIRSIILCGSPMIKELYTAVIDTCDLSEDMLTWKERDLRFVDNKQSLSGGQIARIGIARALYRYHILKIKEPDFNHLFILDNCFRSVDIPVAVHILSKLFSGVNAVLREANTILVISPTLKDILLSKYVGSFSCSIREYKFTNEGITHCYAFFKKSGLDFKNYFFNMNSIDANYHGSVNYGSSALQGQQVKLNLNSSYTLSLEEVELNEAHESPNNESETDSLVQVKHISENDFCSIIQSKESSPLLEKISDYGSVSFETYKSYLCSVNKLTLTLIILGIIVTVVGGNISQFSLTYILDLISGTENNSKDDIPGKSDSPINVIPYGPSRNIDLRKHVSRFALDGFMRPLKLFLVSNLDSNNNIELDVYKIVERFGYLLFIIILGTFGAYVFEGIACIQACKYYHNSLLYKVLINSSIPTLIKIPVGQILNKFSTDIILIDWNTMRSIGRVSWGLISFTINIALLSILAPWTLPIFIIIMGLVMFKIFIPMISASRNLQRSNLVAFSPLCSIMSSTLEGTRTIFLLKNCDHFERLALNILEYMQRIRFLQHTSLIWCNTRIQLFILPISFLSSVIRFISPVSVKYIQERISSPILLYYINILSQPLTIAWGISKCLSLAENATTLMVDWIQMEKEMCSVERIIELCEQISQRDKEMNYNYHRDDVLEKKVLLGLKMKSNRKVLFIKENGGNEFKRTYDNIFFSLLSGNHFSNNKLPILSLKNISIDYYIRGPYPILDTSNCIIKNISLNAFSGEVIGIIGRTGSGKSSLFNAILNISPTLTGSITLMGQQIHSIPRYLLRNYIGVIPQVVCIIPNCTVRDIIDPFQQYNDNEIHNVLKICGIYKYINNNLNGIHSRIILQKKTPEFHFSPSSNSASHSTPHSCHYSQSHFANEGTESSKIEDVYNCLTGKKHHQVYESNLKPFVISEIYLRYLYTCRILLYSRNYNLVLIDEPIVFQNQSSIDSSINDQTLQIIDIISTYCSHCAIITISHDINIIKKCKRVYHLIDGVLNEISSVKHPNFN